MKYNTKTAGRYKKEYKLPNGVLKFWKENNFLPDILDDPNLVYYLADTKRGLVVKFLHNTWINKLGIERLGIAMRFWFREYKTNPADMRPWVVAVLYDYVCSVNSQPLTEQRPLEFIAKNEPLVMSNPIGSYLGFNGKGMKRYIQLGIAGYNTNPERNKKIYNLLRGTFMEFVEVKEEFNTYV